MLFRVRVFAFACLGVLQFGFFLGVSGALFLCLHLFRVSDIHAMPKSKQYADRKCKQHCKPAHLDPVLEIQFKQADQLCPAKILVMLRFAIAGM